MNSKFIFLSIISALIFTLLMSCRPSDNPEVYITILDWSLNTNSTYSSDCEVNIHYYIANIGNVDENYPFRKYSFNHWHVIQNLSVISSNFSINTRMWCGNIPDIAKGKYTNDTILIRKINSSISNLSKTNIKQIIKYINPIGEPDEYWYSGPFS